MRRTMADIHLEEGTIRGLREALLVQLPERFGEIPPDIVATIEATTSLAQLKEWAKRLVKANTLEEVGIGRAAERTRKGRR